MLPLSVVVVGGSWSSTEDLTVLLVVGAAATNVAASKVRKIVALALRRITLHNIAVKRGWLDFARNN